MLRKTLVSMAVAASLYVSNGYALELGELISQSNEDEPYRGTIELSDTGNLAPVDVLVRLGSESEFKQAGFAPTRVLSQLKFDVVKSLNNNLVVQVSSERPLNTDELHFVLAARWPSGQVVREYETPLKQEPLVDKSQSEVVQSSKVTAPSSNSSNTVFRDETSVANGMQSKGLLGVSRGNTLWSIAGDNLSSNQLTIYQTMMAIQALNKEAFYANNINLLKEGVVLRLPTQDQIALFNKTLSKQEFQRQHNAWMELKKAGQNGLSMEQAQMNTQAKSKSASMSPMSEGDKLTLTSGQSALPEKASSSNVGNGKSSSKLQSDLSAAQEMLDKEKREKDELSTQLGDLNKQLETLEKLITLKDKQMAELQKQLTSAQQAMQEQKNTVDQLLEADQIRREKEQSEEDSIVHKIFANPIIVSISAVILMLLGFLIGLVMRKSGKKTDDFSSKDDEFDLASPAPVAPVVTPVVEDAMSSREPDFDESLDKEPEELQEEDPFAFDFETPDNSDSFDEFDNLDVDVASVDTLAEVAPEEAFQDEFDSSESDEIIPELDTFADVGEEDSDDSLEEMGQEDTFDSDLDDIAAEEPEDNDDDELEIVSDDDDIPVMDDMDFDLEEEFPAIEESAIDEEDIPTMDVEDGLEGDEDGETVSEEESFVSSLLNDVDQDDVDESAIFDREPSESIASTIEETLAEAQEELDDEFDIPEFGETEASEDEEVSDEEEEFNFFDASGDEVATKLDLARAYMDMGDDEGARVILEDVIESGNDQQVAEAKSMMERMFPSE